MPSRNTPVLQMIVEALNDSSPETLARLERGFENSLLIIAGNVNQVMAHAAILRLAITREEAAQTLDHIGATGAAIISIDHVEEAVNTLFPGRFIEP